MAKEKRHSRVDGKPHETKFGTVALHQMAIYHEEYLIVSELSVRYRVAKTAIVRAAILRLRDALAEGESLLLSLPEARP